MSWFKNIGPESKSLREIQEHFLQMLQDGRTAYEAARFGIEFPADADVPMTTQERAYTSPIWYTP